MLLAVVFPREPPRALGPIKSHVGGGGFWWLVSQKYPFRPRVLLCCMLQKPWDTAVAAQKWRLDTSAEDNADPTGSCLRCMLTGVFLGLLWKPHHHNTPTHALFLVPLTSKSCHQLHCTSVADTPLCKCQRNRLGWRWSMGEGGVGFGPVESDAGLYLVAVTCRCKRCCTSLEGDNSRLRVTHGSASLSSGGLDRRRQQREQGRVTQLSRRWGDLC